MRRGLALFLVLSAGSARAADKLDKVVAAGLQCYEQLNLGCTIAKLASVRARVDGGESLAPADQMRACETLGSAYAAIEKAPEAEGAFGWCFQVDPAYHLDPNVVGPRIFPHYQRARDTFLRGRLDLAPLLPSWPEIAALPPRLELALHTPSEILLSGSGRLERRTHALGFGAGGAFLFGEDAGDFEPGLALEIDYAYSLLTALRLAVHVDFGLHATARDDIKAGYASTLYRVTVQLGLEGVLTIADFVEIGGGLLAGATLAGVGSVQDRTGGALTLRATVAFRIGSDFALGIDLDPTLVIAELADGSLGTSVVMPVMLSFDARF